MDSIKFRVWEKSVEKMFEWGQLEAMKYLLGDKKLMKSFIVVPSRESDVVMQFTGMKDRIPAFAAL